MSNYFALIACTILAGLAVFQLSLVLGAPFGKFAWEGLYDVLPSKLRIGSLISIILYGIFAMIILIKTGLIDFASLKGIANAGIWVLTVYFFIGVVMNGISRSKSERMVMTPLSLVLAMLFLFVSLHG
jgi:hypothetical protein